MGRVSRADAEPRNDRAGSHAETRARCRRRDTGPQGGASYRRVARASHGDGTGGRPTGRGATGRGGVRRACRNQGSLELADNRRSCKESKA